MLNFYDIFKKKKWQKEKMAKSKTNNEFQSI
jgi:hypothetical protein